MKQAGFDSYQRALFDDVIDRINFLLDERERMVRSQRKQVLTERIMRNRGEEMKRLNCKPGKKSAPKKSLRPQPKPMGRGFSPEFVRLFKKGA